MSPKSAMKACYIRLESETCTIHFVFFLLPTWMANRNDCAIHQINPRTLITLSSPSRRFFDSSLFVMKEHSTDLPSIHTNIIKPVPLSKSFDDLCLDVRYSSSGT
ncbi:hypothetical protein CDAR_56081 [Caerostris darwini]|uniref:Ycf15 n=1 Tax=Caerostris darwini TaxID=1538125 RepID=A0AAV4RP01_9ARAC|nr:hypothetical protein CDAR_56081 [Caerostris darwini]